ncbi:MAG: hypothetical protein GAK30_00734 [Paracidovorax wautersii]|uniref:Acyl-CoA thioester hydrolase n=1 Tax=Paracidovorax wautersii TaxID=1177982 RepID=A0A7V8JRC1_9BURK|nr:MAG: hypothetical protein GAK30_00734 [Paracidovorax wautersii]
MRSRGVFGVDTRIQVPFFDVDVMQIVWHGHYVKYLEQARCALLDALGYNYNDMTASGYAWPVVDLQLRYVQPATFGQVVIVRAELVEWASRLVVNYLIRDEATGQRLTRGSTTQVAVEVASREMQLASPAVLLRAVERVLA